MLTKVPRGRESDDVNRKAFSRDVTTDRLERILEKVSSDAEANQYIREYAFGQYDSFSEYVNDYIAGHKLEINDVITRSNISRNYIYNILNGKRNPGRDKVIALCIGSGMGIKEINRGLKIANHGILYAKDERDARIIIGINRGIRSVIDVNIILEQHGLDILE